MGATTVKLDAEILSEIAKAKPAGETLSSFVRNAIKRDIRRSRMKHAAEAYLALLASSPAEREEQERWESALLSQPPRGREK